MAEELPRRPLRVAGSFCMWGKAVLLRAIPVTLFVLLAAAQVVRTAIVAAFAETNSDSVSNVWPTHPQVLRSVAMRDVGEAAAAGGEVPPQALQRLEQLAGAAPFAVEPFLVHGAIAQRGGDFERTERLLVHARALEPRSPAARFLLADLYFRTGRIPAGLTEMSVLGRLIPGAAQQVAPALAAYATSEGASPHLRRILLVYPELERPLLGELAEDPRNAELILAIARPRAPADAPPPWQGKLLRTMVEQGEFARAHSLWARLSGVPQEGSRGLFDPRFSQTGAPPPFGWSLESSGRGVAEPAGGGLGILYYGREDTVLASQTMLLPAGRYRLETAVAGAIGEGSQIGWTVTCLPGSRRLLELGLSGRPGGPIAGEFAVPGQGCTAQTIALRGVGKEFPQTADFRIENLNLTRVGD